MRERAGYKRKQYLVAKEFQLKYAGMILLLVFLTGALCSYVVYYTSMLFMGDKLANVYPQGRLVSIVNMVNSRILLSIILIAPLVAIIGIFVSHRIAGPLYRMEKFLDGMAAGDFSSYITLRKNDDLIKLADGINRVIDGMKGTIGSDKAHLGRITASLAALKQNAASKHVSKPGLEDELDALTNELNELNRELDRYKI